MENRMAKYEIVAKHIREWDPYGLLRTGAPDDEFDSEIAAVTPRILPDSSRHEIAAVLSAVFSSAFEPEPFTVPMCYDVADRISRDLKNIGDK